MRNEREQKIADFLLGHGIDKKENRKHEVELRRRGIMIFNRGGQRAIIPKRSIKGLKREMLTKKGNELLPQDCKVTDGIDNYVVDLDMFYFYPPAVELIYSAVELN